MCRLRVLALNSLRTPRTSSLVLLVLKSSSWSSSSASSSSPSTTSNRFFSSPPPPSSSSSPSSDLVQFSHDPTTKIGTITLQSSTRHNPLTVEMGRQFQSTIQAINNSISSNEININSIILHGANSTFSAGGDINWLKDLSKNPVHVNTDIMLQFYKSFLCVRELHVPVISAIEGYAVGAGACLAIATDVRIMAHDAKIGFNFVKLGIHAGMGGSHFLPLAVGEGKAMEILLMGKMIDGVEAERLGVVQKVVHIDRTGDAVDGDGDSNGTGTGNGNGTGNKNGEEVLDEARKVAKRIGKMHPLAVRSMVQTMRLREDSMGMGLESALRREAYAQALCYAREDWGEGLDAVTQKRQPSFDDYHSDWL